MDASFFNAVRLERRSWVAREFASFWQGNPAARQQNTASFSGEDLLWDLGSRRASRLNFGIHEGAGAGHFGLLGSQGCLFKVLLWSFCFEKTLHPLRQEEKALIDFVAVIVEAMQGLVLTSRGDFSASPRQLSGGRGLLDNGKLQEYGQGETWGHKQQDSRVHLLSFCT